VGRKAFFGLGQHQAVCELSGEAVDISQDNTNIFRPHVALQQRLGISGKRSRSRFNNRFPHAFI